MTEAAHTTDADDATGPDDWLAKVRSTTTPSDPTWFALRCFGVSEDQVSMVYKSRCATTCPTIPGPSRSPVEMEENAYVSLFTADSLSEEVKKRVAPVRHRVANATWTADPIVELIRKVGNSYEVTRCEGITAGVTSCQNGQDFFTSLNSDFSTTKSRVELVLLLPEEAGSPKKEESTSLLKNTRWNIFDVSPRIESSVDVAVFFGGLSVLGLSHREAGDRSAYFPKLGRVVPALAEFVWSRYVNRRGQSLRLSKLFQQLPNESVLLDQGNDQYLGFAVNYSSYWRESSGRISSWVVKDRRSDIIKALNALNILMSHASGSVTRISLPFEASVNRSTNMERTRKATKPKRSLHIIAPTPWIEALTDLHGALGGAEANYQPNSNFPRSISKFTYEIYGSDLEFKRVSGRPRLKNT